MQWKNILYNIAFALACLLLFLLIFEKHLSPQPWLQVFGRMHPLFLHIPIGLILLYAIIEIFLAKRSDEAMRSFKDGLLLIATLSVIVTALMGLFLSREDGYDSDAIALHKWTGAALSFLLLIWYQIRGRRVDILSKVMAITSIILVGITGHLGGEITHGENFVLAPVEHKVSGPAVPFDEAIVFRDMIQPILREKCLLCHNSSKAKGELVMETTGMILKGGKNGKLWDTTENDMGLLLHRINLPLENEDHMPPAKKPQLSETEKIILRSWIKSGSSFTVKVLDLKEGDTLKTIASTMFSNGLNETYTFDNADDRTIRALNNYYRVVQPIAEGSPALAVNFFGTTKFNGAAIKELAPVHKQVVDMDLSRMPVDDTHLPEIAAFENIRKLNLAFTKINGTGLMSLKKLKHLRELSLSGTNVDAQVMDSLKQFSALRKVFVWNVPRIDSDVLARLKSDTGKLKFETGYRNDTLVLKLTPPIVRNDKFVLTEPAKLLLKHNINGAQIHYTVDGSEPDSINSPLYNKDVIISKTTLVKAKVFRKGWISSDVETIPFYFSNEVPTEVSLLTSPNELFQADGGPSLFDRTLGGTTTTSGGWLGFRFPQVFQAEVDFGKEIHSKMLTINTLLATNDDVFPPEMITVWYSNEKGKWKLLKEVHPTMPKKKMDNKAISYIFEIPDGLRYIKIKALPLKRVPKWQSKTPDSAWFFIDEIILN